LNVTLDYLKSNRKWLIRDFRVWGKGAAIDTPVMYTESDASANRIIFAREFVGASEQVVHFNELIDHRGNSLPGQIENAEIIPIAKNDIPVHLRGSIGPGSFRIARGDGYTDDATVDLIIMEMN